MMQFDRILKRRHVIALAFGAMVGWSWVLLTGPWIARAGTLGAVAAFAIAGLVMVLIALTYAELAAAIGKPGAARAVARACAANPVAVAVPCHRVVRGDGDLSGYRWGVERKRELLARERDSDSVTG